MSYYTVKLKKTESSDIHQSLLWDSGALGIEETEAELIAFFPNEFRSEYLPDLLEDIVIEISEHEEENWMENWKESFKPQIIGDQFIIKPSWEEISNPENRLIINIEPKMAFGTGTHETTQLVLELLPKHHHNAAKVLDFGCGSGVLSIAAEKLGSTEILGIDIDDESMENSIENSDLNQCKAIQFNKMSLHSINKSFNLILANINKHVLVAEANKLIDLLEPNGMLIISGLLETDQHEILQKYKDINFIEIQQKNEWIALVFSKS